MTQQVKCVLNFLIVGSVFELLSESNPVNSKLTIQPQEICSWKVSESNYHKQLITSNQQWQINYNATKTKFDLQFL